MSGLARREARSRQVGRCTFIVVLFPEPPTEVECRLAGVTGAGEGKMPVWALEGTVEASEYYLRTTPYFETAAPEHAWINGIVVVAMGGRSPGGVKYELFEIL